MATNSVDHVVTASGRLVDLTLPIQPGEGRFGLLTEFETAVSFADVAWQGSTLFSTHCSQLQWRIGCVTVTRDRPLRVK